MASAPRRTIAFLPLAPPVYNRRCRKQLRYELLDLDSYQDKRRMIFAHIDKLKKDYTDKYVVVDESRPELQRFRGLTGMVKTVNYSGRALVEFDGYNNIGWYDIDPAFLKVVDAPLPKPVETKKDKAAAPKAVTARSPAAGEKPIGEKKPAAAPAKAAAAPAKPVAAAPAGKSVADILAAARKPAGEAGAPVAEAKPAAAAPAKVAPGGKGMSMADILAAARGKGGAAAPAAKVETAPAAEKPAAPAKSAAPAAEKPAAEKPAAAPAAKVAPGGKGMSMDDILAMARGKKAAGAAPAPAAPAAKPAPAAPAPPAEPEAAAEESAAAEEPAESPAASATTASSGSKKDEITSIADQIAYCRKVDAK